MRRDLIAQMMVERRAFECPLLHKTDMPWSTVDVRLWGKADMADL
jgi:hypothetical protein